MRIIGNLLVLATLSATATMTASAQGRGAGTGTGAGAVAGSACSSFDYYTTCGTYIGCGAGPCPPTFPMGAAPGENHKGENWSGFDLSGANLSQAHLSMVSFVGTNLSGANLSCSRFSLSEFDGADVTGADFSDAHGIGHGCSGALGIAFYDCTTNFTGSNFDPVAAGWINVSPCGTCVPVTETIRLGTPTNPNVFLPGQTSGPIIGSTWDPVIDHSTFMPTALFDFLAITATATNISLPPLGTLLCDSTLTFTIEGSAAGSPFAVPIPDDCAFVGASVCTQGASLDALGNILFTNALDITIGTF